VYLSDNSNIGVDGFPKKNMIHEDGYWKITTSVSIILSSIPLEIVTVR
jgi:hypothetical protein